MEENSLGSMVQDHERRITALESNYDTLQGKIVGLENGLLRTENTILVEFKEAKELTKELINQRFDLDKKKLSGKEKVTLALISTFGSVVGVGGVVGFLQLFVK